MKRSSTVWAIAFSLMSGVYWYVTAHFFNLVAPMMLNYDISLLRILLEVTIVLLIYGTIAITFFRWLTQRERN